MASRFTETTKILQEEPYVKVATREIAILVQEVQNSQREKKDLKERCLNLENYISRMRPSNVNEHETRSSFNTHMATVIRGAFFPPSFKLESYLKPEMALAEIARGQSSNFVDNDLEEDSVSVTEMFTKPDFHVREQPRDITQSETVFQYPQVDGISTSDDFVQPRILPQYQVQTVSKNKFFGVSPDSFNMALTELAKCKKSNAELIKMTEKAPQSRSEMNDVEEKVRQVELEKTALQNKIQALERNVTDETQTDIINTLQRKIFQQERQSSLRNLAFDQLNKQCDKWRRKYEEMSNEFGQLAKQINSTQFEVVRDAPIIGQKLSEMSNSSSTPNFAQLLKGGASPETDVVMYDKYEGDAMDQINPESKTANANINVKQNVNKSQDKQDVNKLDNMSSVNEDNVLENQTTVDTTSSSIQVFFRNLNARNDVSTQMDGRVFGKNKLVQTDNNNNVADEQTQTDARLVTSTVNDNEKSAEMILDLTSENDFLNEQYESMRDENTVLKSRLADKDKSSIASELANRMKQLNLQLFSVYRNKEKDSLNRMIEVECDEFRRETPERGLYSMSSIVGETSSRKTIKINPRQILSELSADFSNLNSSSGLFQREYKSCPGDF